MAYAYPNPVFVFVHQLFWAPAFVTVGFVQYLLCCLYPEDNKVCKGFGGEGATGGRWIKSFH